ncbi:MAG TPA: hypothetical protein DCX27_01660 [Balneola sp.]|jgi:hypothetical protein|nr:hypothetical protein [Balneola sp.]|tara:strand:- start:2768 stop:3112 length:345 start_codon:yes stop_codon:yes gene_type:complete
MKITRKELKEMIIQELRYAGTGAVAAQDDGFGQEALYKIDKYGQYFTKMTAIFDQLRDSIISDIKTDDLPRNLSIMLLTDHFERFVDEIFYKKQEIIMAEEGARGKIRADVKGL